MTDKPGTVKVTTAKGKFYVSFLAKAHNIGYVPIHGPYNTKQEAEQKLAEVK